MGWGERVAYILGITRIYGLFRGYKFHLSDVDEGLHMYESNFHKCGAIVSFDMADMRARVG